MNVVSCPQDIIAEMNSKDGMLDVTWDDPVFRDSMDNLLPFTCFPTGPFNVGNRTIKCMDSKYQEAKCQFNVVVTSKCAQFILVVASLVWYNFNKKPLQVQPYTTYAHPECRNE